MTSPALNGKRSPWYATMAIHVSIARFDPQFLPPPGTHFDQADNEAEANTMAPFPQMETTESVLSYSD